MRITAISLPLEIEPVSGLINASNNKNVNPTTIWAMTLFPSFIHFASTKRSMPEKTGISAVGEGDTDPK